MPTFTTPASATIAPPGYYMLFIINAAKPGLSRQVPSVARWLRLGPNSLQFSAAVYRYAEGSAMATEVTVTRTGTTTQAL